MFSVVAAKVVSAPSSDGDNRITLVIHFKSLDYSAIVLHLKLHHSLLIHPSVGCTWRLDAIGITVGNRFTEIIFTNCLYCVRIFFYILLPFRLFNFIQQYYLFALLYIFYFWLANPVWLECIVWLCTVACSNLLSLHLSFINEPALYNSRHCDHCVHSFMTPQKRANFTFFRPFVLIILVDQYTVQIIVMHNHTNYKISF